MNTVSDIPRRLKGTHSVLGLSSIIDFVLDARLSNLSANDVARATPRLGDSLRDSCKEGASDFPLLPLNALLKDLPDFALLTLIPSCEDLGGITRSNVGDGGVVTGAESSEDISEDMLWRGYAPGIVGSFERNEK